MTAKKNLKRLVRSRARKTGESYAAALWQIRKERHVQQTSSNPAPTLRRIAKPEYGFALTLPEDWAEHPPDTRTSPWEVGRFVPSGSALPGHRGITVFRSPAPDGADARVAALAARPAFERAGYRDIRVSDATLAGRPASRLDCERPIPTGVLTCRQYRVVVDGITVCLGFTTSDPDRDFPFLDRVVASFELIGDLANAAARPPRNQPLAIERPEQGFAIKLPDGWVEEAPDLNTNPWEVARFVEPGDRRHTVSVTRRVAPSLTSNDLAEEGKALLGGLGFGDFRLSDVPIAGREALRMDCEQRDGDRVWMVRCYFTKSDGVHLILFLETAAPEQDAALLEQVAADFRPLVAA